MAINNGFGAEVTLHVKKDSHAISEFNREIEQAMASAGKINIGEILTVKTLSPKVTNNLQNRLFSTQFQIRIHRIEARDAINNVRNELARMVEAFRIDNGVNIQGIGSFTDGAYEAAYQRRAAAAQQAAGATRDEANAEQQVLSEAEATNRELTQQINLVRDIERASRDLSKFRTNNPFFSGGVRNDASSNVQATADALDKLKQAVISENAANSEAMDEHRRRLAAAQEQIAAYQAQVAETGRVESEAALNLDPLVDKLDILSNKAAGLSSSSEFIGQINNMQAQVRALQTAISNFASTGEGDMEAIRAEASKLGTELANIEASMNRTAKVEGLDFTKLRGQLENVRGAALKLDTNGTFLSQLQTIETDINALQNATHNFSELSEADVQRLITTYRRLSDEIKNVRIDVGTAARTDSSAGDSSAQSMSANLNFLKQVETAYKSAQAILNNNTKLFGTGLGEQLQAIISSYDNLIQKIVTSPAKTKAAADTYQAAFNELRERTAAVGLEMERTGIKGNTMITRLAQGIKKFGGWTIVTRALTSVIRLARQVVTNVKEIDAAMTQLKIVTNSSSSEMSEFGDKIAATAKKIGASITDLIDSATTYARLGYSLKESNTLAEYTSMLKNVGDIDVSDAQDAVTAITKAFNIDASQIETVMDKLVTVGKESCPAA